MACSNSSASNRGGEQVQWLCTSAQLVGLARALRLARILAALASSRPVVQHARLVESHALVQPAGRLAGLPAQPAGGHRLGAVRLAFPGTGGSRGAAGHVLLAGGGQLPPADPLRNGPRGRDRLRGHRVAAGPRLWACAARGPRGRPGVRCAARPDRRGLGGRRLAAPDLLAVQPAAHLGGLGPFPRVHRSGVSRG